MIHRLVHLAFLLALGAVRAAAAEGGDHGGHMAPLVPDPTSAETFYSALWVIIIFVILLAILYPTAWKQVLAGLRQREERIRREIAEAEAQNARAQETLREYSAKLAEAQSQVRQMLAEAAAQGERIATEIKMRAQQEVEEIKARSTRDIEAARVQAITQIHDVAAELSTAMARRILGRQLGPEDHQRLIRESLEEYEKIEAAGASRH
jgi:F-type H+-transporting ATPase subunit b